MQRQVRHLHVSYSHQWSCFYYYLSWLTQITERRWGKNHFLCTSTNFMHTIVCCKACIPDVKHCTRSCAAPPSAPDGSAWLCAARLASQMSSIAPSHARVMLHARLWMGGGAISCFLPACMHEIRSSTQKVICFHRRSVTWVNQLN
jgi:hypothetical protein